ncbi:transposase [Endozoicomonas ascidiicola]|uniref:transposase n=1 Tax=Endozoicomonas ascidiicola TaxID=1698521 RepID=UPI0008339F35|nr:transposase [Endozoicomonas ascidiicola]
MTTARKNLIDPASTRYYHCMARCVRRAFLCGRDKFSGKNYEHRRQWVEDRLKILSGIFALELCAYAVMSNHYHVILHINREQAESWNTKEVLSRWAQLFSGPVLVQRYLAGAPMDKGSLLKVEEFAEEYRCRLKDISWFMKCLNEHLAREANKEDGCKGRFWEGHYKSQALLDEAALLTCMAYVDLNPVRAKMAKTPEGSEYTSIKERVDTYSSHQKKKQPRFLKPFKTPGQNPDKALPYTLACYFELVDWSGRIVHKGKRGKIEGDVPAVLDRLGIDPKEWLSTMRWNNRFRRGVGKLSTLRDYASQTGKHWLHGVTPSICLFQT